jgi:hypothetical protein
MSAAAYVVLSVGSRTAKSFQEAIIQIAEYANSPLGGNKESFNFQELACALALYHEVETCSVRPKEQAYNFHIKYYAR